MSGHGSASSTGVQSGSYYSSQNPPVSQPVSPEAVDRRQAVGSANSGQTTSFQTGARLRNPFKRVCSSRSRICRAVSKRRCVENSIGASVQSAVIRIGRRSGFDPVPPVWMSFLVFFKGVAPITEVIPWPTDNDGRSRQSESVLHQPAPGLAIPRHGALADR